MAVPVKGLSARRSVEKLPDARLVNVTAAVLPFPPQVDVLVADNVDPFPSTVTVVAPPTSKLEALRSAPLVMFQVVPPLNGIPLPKLI